MSDVINLSRDDNETHVYYNYECNDLHPQTLTTAS